MNSNFFAQKQHLFSPDSEDLTERLSERHKYIIQENLDAFDNKSVIDIACHDGRWSFAALDAGATNVVGVEARAKLCARAKEIASELEEENYVFMEDDAHMFMARQQAQKIQTDTVLIFGFLYHTANIPHILHSATRLAKEYIIIDTNIVTADRAIAKFHYEDSAPKLAAFHPDNKQVLVSVPSLAMIRMILHHEGWDCHPVTHFDSPLRDYASGRRVTICCRKRD